MHEYNISLYIPFIDYQKTSDSIRHGATSEHSRGKKHHLTSIPSSFNKETFQVKKSKISNKMPVQKGVRQGKIL